MNHGHVTPNKDGSKARCGGPGICPICSTEAKLKELNARDEDNRPISDYSLPALRQERDALRNKVIELRAENERLLASRSQYTDGLILMPPRLTAGGGAKGAMNGQFFEICETMCEDCIHGDDECDACENSGLIRHIVPVTWTTIKEIYAKAVALLREEQAK